MSRAVTGWGVAGRPTLGEGPGFEASPKRTLVVGARRLTREAPLTMIAERRVTG